MTWVSSAYFYRRVLTLGDQRAARDGRSDEVAQAEQVGRGALRRRTGVDLVVEADVQQVVVEASFVWGSHGREVRSADVDAQQVFLVDLSLLEEVFFLLVSLLLVVFLVAHHVLALRWLVFVFHGDLFRSAG